MVRSLVRLLSKAFVPGVQDGLLSTVLSNKKITMRLRLVLTIFKKHRKVSDLDITYGGDFGMNSFADKNKDIIWLIARIFLASLFLIQGFGKMTGDIAGTVGYMESNGVPLSSVLVYAVITVELLGGVLLVVGFKTRWAAFLLAGFCLLTLIWFHPPFDPDQTIQALKNLAIAGGLLALVANGPGALSADGDDL